MRTLRKYTGFSPKIHSFALIFSFLLVGATPQQSTAFADSTKDGIKLFRSPLTPQAIEGEFIVHFKDESGIKDFNTNKLQTISKSLDTEIKMDQTISGLNVARITSSKSLNAQGWENLAGVLSQNPNVSAVEPNYMVHALGPINDPYLGELWHLNNVEAFKAWEKLPASKSNEEEIIVAVIDTGMQLDHEDLKDHIWINKGEIPNNRIDDDNNGYIDDVSGWNFYDDNKINYAYNNPWPVVRYNPDTRDIQCSPHPTRRAFETHATHVAGIIAATHNNSKGIAGISPNVKIMPLKAIGGPCGWGAAYSVLRSVQYAVDNGAKIINLSLGSYSFSPLAQSVYKKYSDQGILFVVAAGNESNDNDARHHSYPASYPAEGIISVAASKQDDTLTDFSNYGTRSVDIAAPGFDILSAIPVEKDNPHPVSAYDKYDGTSMAAPVVAGAAAVLKSLNQKMTNLQLKAALLNSVDKIDGLKGKVLTEGRLNIYKAISQPTRIARNEDPSFTRPSTPEQNQEPAQSMNQEDSIGGIRIFDNRSSNQRW